MKRFILISAALLLAVFQLRAQNVSDLIISEALADPDSTCMVDDYGYRNGWIEIFNTSQGTVNIGGCFLTDDRADLHKSLVPKGDLKTQIGPRQTVVFYASGKGHQGTFYTDFKVAAGKTIYLISNDGRTIIDSLVVPATLPVGKSVSKMAFDNKQMDYQPQAQPTDPTPGIPNKDVNAKSKSQQMAETDPHGFILSIVAVSVVFSALAILWFLFWVLFERPAKKKKERASQPTKPAKVKGGSKGVTPEVAAAISMALDQELGGDVYAAIATAMHLYLSTSAHDAESFILTIKPSAASGWNDKKQNFRKSPRK